MAASIAVAKQVAPLAVRVGTDSSEAGAQGATMEAVWLYATMARWNAPRSAGAPRSCAIPVVASCSARLGAPSMEEERSATRSTFAVRSTWSVGRTTTSASARDMAIDGRGF